jgi:hypothetical protein
MQSGATAAALGRLRQVEVTTTAASNGELSIVSKKRQSKMEDRRNA